MSSIPESIIIGVMVVVTLWCVLLWHAFLTRIKKGKFSYLQKEKLRVIFETNFGRFTVDGEMNKVLCNSNKGEFHSWSFDEFKGVHYLHRETGATLTEYFLGGFDLTDLFPQYHDKHVSYTIALVLHNTENVPHNARDQHFALESDLKVPLFVAAQYQERDLLPVIPWLLAKMGWHNDVADYSRHVLKEILTTFNACGKKLEMLA